MSDLHITASALAKRMGRDWSTRRVKRWLRKTGAGSQLSGDGGHWVTTAELLLDRWPAAHTAWMLGVDDSEPERAPVDECELCAERLSVVRQARAEVARLERQVVDLTNRLGKAATDGH